MRQTTLIAILLVVLVGCKPEIEPFQSDASTQDTQTSGQDTQTTGQDTHTAGQDTHTTGQDTNTTGQDTNTTGQDTNVAGDTGGDVVDPPKGDPRPLFRIGMTYPTSDWGGAETAELMRDVGLNGTHRKFPLSLFDEWGYSAERGKLEAYTTTGVDQLLAYLISPPEGESTAPTGSSSFERDGYLPANLHEPIWNDQGACQVNTGNTWATDLFGIMNANKDLVSIWAVWESVDATGDTPGDWLFDAPEAGALTNLKTGSIYDYIRMLRIAKEVRDCVAPDTQISLGMMVHPEFLGALLRYTDDPQKGAVTAEHPEKAAAYFDAVQFLYVPLSGANSDTVIAGFEGKVSQFEGELTRAGLPGMPYTPMYAHGIGIPTDPGVSDPSGPEIARNIQMKLVVRAWQLGLWGIEFRYLGVDGSRNTRDKTMSFYPDFASFGSHTEAVPNEAGVGLATLTTVLDPRTATFDPEGSKALGLTSEVDGAAFKDRLGRPVLVLWAKTSGNNEDAAFTFEFLSDADFAVHAWDYSTTSSTTDVTSSSGVVSVPLTGTPVILTSK